MVWFLIENIRLAMAYREENLTLAGYIEMDEAFFGGRNRSKGIPPPKGKRKPPSYNKKRVPVLVESEGRHAGNLVMTVAARLTRPRPPGMFKPLIPVTSCGVKGFAEIVSMQTS